jgi:hypothetical protein
MRLLLFVHVMLVIIHVILRVRVIVIDHSCGIHGICHDYKWSICWGSEQRTNKAGRLQQARARRQHQWICQQQTTRFKYKVN